MFELISRCICECYLLIQKIAQHFHRKFGFSEIRIRHASFRSQSRRNNHFLTFHFHIIAGSITPGRALLSWLVDEHPTVRVLPLDKLRSTLLAFWWIVWHTNKKCRAHSKETQNNYVVEIKLLASTRKCMLYVTAQ